MIGDKKESGVRFLYEMLRGFEGGAAARVCFASNNIGPLVRNGVATANTSLAKLLAAHGHDVTMLFTGKPPEDKSESEKVVSDYASLGIRFVILPWGDASGPLHHNRAFEVCKWLIEENVRHPFDVIHFTECQGHGYYALHAKRAGEAFQSTTLAVTPHGSLRWCHEGNSRFVHNFDEVATETIERASLAMADVVLAPSRHMVDWIQSRGWSLPAETYIQQYVLPIAQQAERNHGALQEIVFFGRLEIRKGIHHFIDAITRLDATLPETVEVTFLGEHSIVDAQSSTDYITERAGRWRRKWWILDDLGHAAALEYLNGSGRLAVVASVHDNLPNTILECLALKIPFVASRAGGIPEMILQDDLDSCTYASDGDPAHNLAALITEVVSRPALAVPRFAIEPERTYAAWLAWHSEQAVKARQERQVVALASSWGQPSSHVTMLVAAPTLHEAEQFLEALPAESGSLCQEILVFTDTSEEFADQQDLPCGAKYVASGVSESLQYLRSMEAERSVGAPLLFIESGCRPSADVFGALGNWMKSSPCGVFALPLTDWDGSRIFLPVEASAESALFGLGPGPVFATCSAAFYNLPLPYESISSLLALWHQMGLDIAKEQQLSILTQLSIGTFSFDDIAALPTTVPSSKRLKLLDRLNQTHFELVLSWAQNSAKLQEEYLKNRDRANRLRVELNRAKERIASLRSKLEEGRRHGLVSRMKRSLLKRMRPGKPANESNLPINQEVAPQDQQLLRVPPPSDPRICSLVAHMLQMAPRVRMADSEIDQHWWSSHYGALFVAARYCGLSELPSPSVGFWQHGVHMPWNLDNPKLIAASALPSERCFVARQDEKAALLKHGYQHVEAIGLPIVYLPHREVARLPDSLLIMPAHTLPPMRLNPKATKDYVNAIAKHVRAFKTAVVCLHRSCVEQGFWVGEFRDAGFDIIVGADHYDRNALERVRLMLASFETMTTNVIGSHLFYANYLGTKVSLFLEDKIHDEASYRQVDFYKKNPDAYDQASRRLEERADAPWLDRFRVPPSEAVCDLEFGEHFVGLANKKSHHQLAHLFGWEK